MKTPEPMNQSTQSSELPGTGTTQNPSAMRKALNNLALLAISGLSMLLLVAAPDLSWRDLLFELQRSAENFSEVAWTGISWAWHWISKGTSVLLRGVH